MNTVLLRLARKDADGVRRWTVPGAPNPIILVPARRGMFGVTWVHWPFMRRYGEWERHGVRLDWHRSVAKREIKRLIESVQGVPQ